MLDEFLTTNRDEIITRARANIENRTTPIPTANELENGVPLFLTQLTRILGAPNPEAGHAEITTSATKHGEDMRRMGFSMAQVVQDYGGLCQAITELSIVTKSAISTTDFKTLNECLDHAIAAAVSEFGRRKQQIAADEGIEHLGVLAQELRSVINTATLAFDAIRSGTVAPRGSTSNVVLDCLGRMQTLVHRSLADLRLKSNVQKRTPTLLADVIEDVTVGAAIDAMHRGLELAIDPVVGGVTIDTDAEFLASALSGLLQNAFRFTLHGGRVSLTPRLTGERAQIDVADECGGLPAGKLDALVGLLARRGSERGELGRGLVTIRRAVEESGGTISVRDLSGQGCVFTVDLPRSKEATPPL